MEDRVGSGWVGEEMEDEGGWKLGTSAQDEWSHGPVDSDCMNGCQESGLPMKVTDQRKS